MPEPVPAFASGFLAPYGLSLNSWPNRYACMEISCTGVQSGSVVTLSACASVLLRLDVGSVIHWGVAPRLTTVVLSVLSATSPYSVTVDASQSVASSAVLVRIGGITLAAHTMRTDTLAAVTVRASNGYSENLFTNALFFQNANAQNAALRGYWEQSSPVTFKFGSTSLLATVTVHLTRIGRMVTLHMPNMWRDLPSPCGNCLWQTSSAIDPIFRVSASTINMYGFAPRILNGVWNGSACIGVSSQGIITAFGGSLNEPWPSKALSGWNSVSLSWAVVP